MSPNVSIDVPEKLLNLPDGRTLAYTDNGDRSSSSLVIFFHGAFNVGNAPRLIKEHHERGIHYVAPTLPGWGNSSQRQKDVPYHVALASDITALVEHLHPNDTSLKIYISGGSYGTVPAQMLYGAPFDIFPPGKQVVGCMLLAPISPLNLQKDYASSMTTATYFSIGSPTQYIIIRLLRRLVPILLRNTTCTLEGAEKFIRTQLFGKMEADEQLSFKKWREDNGIEEGQVEREFAGMMVKSVASTWNGFHEIPDVIHSDWGFHPASLDKDHYMNRPIFVIASEGDTMAPDVMAKWLVASYKNSYYKLITGGHLAPLFQLNDLWKEFFQMCGAE